MRLSATNLFKNFILGAIAVSVSTALVSYASWSDPGSSGPNANVPAALNTGSAYQAKSGGLILNAAKSTLFGLIVNDNPSDAANTGRVGIGTANPQAKLDIIGNLEINGAIKPNGAGWNKGDPDKLLAWLGSGQMQWVNDQAWLHIQRVDIADVQAPNGCFQLFLQCPNGWTQKSVEIISQSCGAAVSGPQIAYGGAVRSCYKNF